LTAKFKSSKKALLFVCDLGKGLCLLQPRPDTWNVKPPKTNLEPSPKQKAQLLGEKAARAPTPALIAASIAFHLLNQITQRAKLY